MNGLLHLLDMAGDTIAQLQSQNEALRRENAVLLERQSQEGSSGVLVVDPEPASTRNVHVIGSTFEDNTEAGVHLIPPEESE